MSHIKFENIKAIRATFDIDIEFVDDGDNNIYYYKLQHFYPFVIGNSDNKDLFLYPDNVKINFSISASSVPTAIPPGPFTGGPTLDDYQREYYALVRKISFVETKVVIKRNGALYMHGFIDNQNKVTDYDDLSFEVTILGNIYKLKEIDPRLIDDADEIMLYVDVIRHILKQAIPDFGNVFFTSDIKNQTNVPYGSQPWAASASYFGDYTINFFGEGIPYTNLLELLIAISNSFGCVGTIKGNDYFMIPRYYNSQTGFQVITNQDILHNNGPAVAYSQKLNGMQTLVGSPPVHYTVEDILGIVEKDADGNLLKPEEVEVLRIITAGGTPPGPPSLDWPIQIWVPEFVAGIGNAHWRPSELDAFFCNADPTHKPLWRVVRDSIWPLVNHDRFVYNTMLNTINWDYHKFYKLKNNETVFFRPRRISYDEFEDVSEVSLIEC